ncbi:hypothetical protein KPL78_05605 [Roseomonas sp. HJA6]|uniref:Tripartite tricarboxylate transporter substrate binding protein n=1 Tax=Roseomonas alba TaxID=2846776 RepID=A0ABS7A4W5_9PROT|nr:tripartite tricarboxylate transporter substrate-binding protein [Neoroseomonas alba]MBW6397315.1 hypothetical protein [Neoroseomonas alba]
MRRRALGLSLLGTLATPALALEQRPLRLVVPFAPGGGNDIFARLYAEPLGQRLQRAVVVENRSGASGNIGAEAVVRSPPDGTAMLYASATIAINPSIMANMPFDTERDLLPVSLVVSQPYVAVARADTGVRNVAALRAALQNGRPDWNYGSAGSGSISNIVPALLFRQAGLNVTHVPYRGAGQVVTALLTGEVQFAFLIYPVAKPFLERGDLLPFGVTGTEEMPQLPGIAPFVAQGFPDLVADQWHALFAPRETPMAMAEEVQRGLAETIRTGSIAERLRAEGATPVGSTPQDFAPFFRTELVRWRRIVEAAGVAQAG